MNNPTSLPPGRGYPSFEVGCACGECRNDVHSTAKHCDWLFCDECYLSGHAQDCPDKPGEIPCSTD